MQDSLNKKPCLDQNYYCDNMFTLTDNPENTKKNEFLNTRGFLLASDKNALFTNEIAEKIVENSICPFPLETTSETDAQNEKFQHNNFQHNNFQHNNFQHNNFQHTEDSKAKTESLTIKKIIGLNCFDNLDFNLHEYKFLFFYHSSEKDEKIHKHFIKKFVPGSSYNIHLYKFPAGFNYEFLFDYYNIPSDNYVAQKNFLIKHFNMPYIVHYDFFLEKWNLGFIYFYYFQDISKSPYITMSFFNLNAMYQFIKVNKQKLEYVNSRKLLKVGQKGKKEKINLIVYSDLSECNFHTLGKNLIKLLKTLEGRLENLVLLYSFHTDQEKVIIKKYKKVFNCEYNHFFTCSEVLQNLLFQVFHQIDFVVCQKIATYLFEIEKTPNILLNYLNGYTKFVQEKTTKKRGKKQCPSTWASFQDADAKSREDDTNEKDVLFTNTFLLCDANNVVILDRLDDIINFFLDHDNKVLSIADYYDNLYRYNVKFEFLFLHNMIDIIYNNYDKFNNSETFRSCFMKFCLDMNETPVGYYSIDLFLPYFCRSFNRIDLFENYYLLSRLSSPIYSKNLLLDIEKEREIVLKNNIDNSLVGTKIYIFGHLGKLDTQMIKEIFTMVCNNPKFVFYICFTISFISTSDEISQQETKELIWGMFRQVQLNESTNFLKIIFLPNMGADLYPFIYAYENNCYKKSSVVFSESGSRQDSEANKIDPREDSYIIKIHTKTDKLWKNELEYPFMHCLEKSIDILCNNHNIGVVSSGLWILKNDFKKKKELKKFMANYKIDPKYMDFSFVGGTIFMIKKSCLDVFFERYNISFTREYKLFEADYHTHIDHSIVCYSHVWERIISGLILATQNIEIYGM